MSSPEDRARHSRRIKAKQKEKVRSMIAKDLLSGKYKKKVIEDKRKEYDVKKMSFRDLVEAINGDE